MKVRIRRSDGVVQTYHVRSLKTVRAKYRYDKAKRVWYKPKPVKPVKPVKPKPPVKRPVKPKVRPKVKGVVVTISFDYRSREYDSKNVEIDAVAQDSVEASKEQIEDVVEKLRDKLVDFLLNKLLDEFGESLIGVGRLRVNYEVVDRKLFFDYDIKIRHGRGLWRRIT